MSKYLSSDFLFQVHVTFTRADQALFVAFATLFVLAIAFRVFQALEKRQLVLAAFFSRCWQGLLVFSIIGGVWAGVRYLIVPILGSHFAAFLILLSLLIWLFFLLKYAIFKLSSEHKAWKAEQVKRKYLSTR